MPETLDNAPESDENTAVEESPTETTEAPETPTGDQSESVQDGQEETEETFPRPYVEKLRQEAADARVKAKDRDTLAQRLHTAQVAATGRLADPADLPYNEEHLDDEEALEAAVDDLLQRKPHLASRRPRGDVGQGQSSDSTGSVDLAAMLRSRA